MQYLSKYQSPIGEILLLANNEALTGLWFACSKHGCDISGVHTEQEESDVLTQTEQWLDVYFQGKQPNFIPPISLSGTEFQMAVWEILLEIPYGQTVTYGDIAKQLAEKFGVRRMSAQAVGQAVGRNPIGLIVPCHRVVGADGTLTGYASGIDKKSFLLGLEGINL